MKEDKITCKICKKQFIPRGKHLRYYHKLNSKSYFDKYILKDKDERFCKECGNEKVFT
jgi:hypothetical protein